MTAANLSSVRLGHEVAGKRGSGFGFVSKAVFPTRQAVISGIVQSGYLQK